MKHILDLIYTDSIKELSQMLKISAPVDNKNKLDDYEELYIYNDGHKQSSPSLNGQVNNF